MSDKKYIEAAATSCIYFVFMTVHMHRKNDVKIGDPLLYDNMYIPIDDC